MHARPCVPAPGGRPMDGWIARAAAAGQGHTKGTRGRETARIVAQLGPGPGRSPPLIQLFAVANSLEMPTGRPEQCAETGEAEVALGVLLCRPSVTYTNGSRSLSCSLFPLSRAIYPPHCPPRSTPHAVGRLLLLLRVPACLPFPRRSRQDPHAVVGEVVASKSSLAWVGCCCELHSIGFQSNQEQRQIRGFLESGRSIKSQV